MELLLSQGEQMRFAEKLIMNGVVMVNHDHPFTFRNGWRSPVKLDFEGTSRELKRAIMLHFSQRAPRFIRSVYKRNTHEVAFVGVPNGGNTYAELLAEQFNAVQYRTWKTDGLEPRVGLPTTARRVCVVVEDVITEAGSTVTLIRSMPSVVTRAALTLFTYGFPRSEEVLQASNIQAAALVSWEGLIQAMKVPFGNSAVKELEYWREDPARWSRSVGFV